MGAARPNPDSVRRILQAAVGLVAGFILGAMALQGWQEGRETDRAAREIVEAAIGQASAPLNLFLTETQDRLLALEAVAEDSPNRAVRLEPGYRRYDAAGADVAGGAPTAAVAEAAARASKSGRPALSLPFGRAGQWYAVIVQPRPATADSPATYEGIQFPVTRILDGWAAMRLPAGSSAALLTSDGHIWLRDPFAPELVGALAAADPFAAAVDTDPSRLSRVVEVETGGIDATVGWRSLETFGLVFAVGVDREQVQAARGSASSMPLLIALAVAAGAFLLVTVTGRAVAGQMPPAAAYPAPAHPVPTHAVPMPPSRAAARAPADEAVPGRNLQAVAENMPVVVFEQRVGPDERVVYDYVSPGMREVYGIEARLLQSDPDILFEMVYPDDRKRVRAEFSAAWRSGDDLDTEYRIVTQDGAVKWVHNFARAARGRRGESRTWDGIVLDVTAQKAAEQELHATKNEAQLTSRVKAEFLANVSHELRTPLNAIIGFAEIISEQSFGPVGVEKYVEYARDIQASADHLLAVVNDILDLSKIEAGRATLVLEDVEAAELVDSCLRLIHGRAAHARLQLRRNVQDGLPRLRVDPLKIKQVLINLLANSIKFTRPGGTVTLRAAATGEGGLTFAVIDTGIGIPEQDLSTAIESYGQVGSLSGDRTEGTGLGLPLAKALTELHGGQLTIQSVPGKGTTVSIALPPECIAPAQPREA